MTWRVFQVCAGYLEDRPGEVSEEQLRQLAQFVSQRVADGPPEVAEAARKYFLRHAAQAPSVDVLERHLWGEAVEVFRDHVREYRRASLARQRFEAACGETARRMREAGIDLAGRTDWVTEFEACDVRMEKMLQGPSEKIVLPRVAKAFFREHLAEFRYIRAREQLIRFEKPIDGPLSLAIDLDTEKVGGLGKTFGLCLGVSAETGPYADLWLMRDLCEIAQLKDLYSWVYLTREDLDRILHTVVQLLRQVLPIFEQCVREEMLKE